MRDGRLRLERIAARLRPKPAVRVFTQEHGEPPAAFEARMEAARAAAGARSRNETWIIVRYDLEPAADQ